jgi:hypothetical protein
MTATPPPREELFVRHYGERVDSGDELAAPAATARHSGRHQQEAVAR